MGEVYKARGPRLDRDVAIEVLPAELASRAEMVHRFGRSVTTSDIVLLKGVR